MAPASAMPEGPALPWEGPREGPWAVALTLAVPRGLALTINVPRGPALPLSISRRAALTFSDT